MTGTLHQVLTASAQDLRDALHDSLLLARALMSLVLGNIFFQIVDPALYAYGVPTSFYYKLGSVLYSPAVLALSFLVLASTLIPHLVVEIFQPSWLNPRTTAKVACYGLLATGVQWMGLAYYIWEWDVPIIAVVFVRLGVGCLFFSLVLGLVLNRDLGRRQRGIQ